MLVALIVPLGAGCGTNSHADGGQALHILEVPTPKIAIDNFVTSGSFVQVAGEGKRLAAVNSALRRSIQHEEAVWKLIATSAYAQNPALRRARQEGVFRTSIDRRLLFANTRVVSVMMPEVAMIPDGTGGGSWLSVTVDVTTGQSIILSELLNGMKGLRAIARRVYEEISRGNPCFARERSLYKGASGDFSPTWSHYANFALTPTGLAIGFPTATVAPPPCGRISTVVPYRIVTPYLTNVGARMVRAVTASTPDRSTGLMRR